MQPSSHLTHRSTTASERNVAVSRARRSSAVRLLSVWLVAHSTLSAGCGAGSTPNASDEGTAQASQAPPDAGKPGLSGSSDAPAVGSAAPSSSKQDAGPSSPKKDAGAAHLTMVDAQTSAAESGDASTTAAKPEADAAMMPVTTSGVAFPPATDLSKDGPYRGTTLQNTGPDKNYTVYLPSELAPNGAKNPIVGWMSGGSTTHTSYPLLPRLATHGFVIVAANVTPGLGDEVNLGKQIIAGIDWAIAENARQGSSLFGKLDTTKIASMGYSMGSLATFTIAGDPRLTTTVQISGGNMMAERVANLHAPSAFICGIPGDSNCNILDTSCDIAAANCDTDFSNATAPVFYTNFKGGHLGILTSPTQDQIGTQATAWLRWKLMSDRTLDPMFVGPDCTVCKDTKWFKVQKKNMP